MHVLRRPTKTHFHTKFKQEKITEFFPWRLSHAVTAAPATGHKIKKTQKRARETGEWGLKGFYKIVDDGTAPKTLVVTSTYPNECLRARQSVRAAIRVAKVRCVVLPDTLARIHEYTFKRCCDLLSIAFPRALLHIANDAFVGCKNIKTIVLPDTLTSIGNNAFDGCTRLTCVRFPKALHYLGRRAFNECIALTSIVLPNGLREIASHLFHGCRGLTSVYLPKTITCVRKRAFGFCNGLTSLQLPNSLTNIEDEAFWCCAYLAHVTIPHGVTFGESVFFACESLVHKSVVYRPPVGRSIFIAWALGKTRNRKNWHITTIERLRNVLRLITEYSIGMCTAPPRTRMVIIVFLGYFKNFSHDAWKRISILVLCDRPVEIMPKRYIFVLQPASG